jgi:hypothetical protein
VNYVFLQHSDSSSLTRILAALIRQTLEKCPQLIMLISPKIDTCRQQSTRFTKEQHAEVLRHLWAQFETVYLIVDGLHEVREKTRCRLLSFFTESPVNVRLFVTSREDLPSRILTPDAKYRIQATREDVRYLVAHQLRYRSTYGKIFDIELEHIANVVFEASNGM